ncbi:MAG: hypothetical protein GTO55_08860 [Armatimonadetes bacterium]|nr:hypothetical protein [Armatimonadota bacterium]NIM24357.1 hypothetical protein [Armatimonadota bacterium]NIM68226.1 hypothetical protein [Armatimonadota bacterium]NIM75127.1 hypothetical protein [Armatimonadota bacterium]NIN06431.1 hypothetical protein [Armatimonadota bacterium]
MAESKVLALRLRQERDLLRGLLASAEEQRDCLIAGKADRLAEIVSQQSALLQKLSRAMNRTATVLGDSEESAQEVADETEECRQLRLDVKELAEDLRRQGRFNWILAREAMRYNDFSISLLAGREEDPSYSAAGRRQSRLSTSLMNRTA